MINEDEEIEGPFAPTILKQCPKTKKALWYYRKHINLLVTDITSEIELHRIFKKFYNIESSIHLLCAEDVKRKLFKPYKMLGLLYNDFVDIFRAAPKITDKYYKTYFEATSLAIKLQERAVILTWKEDYQHDDDLKPNLQCLKETSES